MNRARINALFTSVMVGGLVAVHCYLFFEDGILAEGERHRASVESDSLPADDTTEDTPSPKPLSEDEG